MLKVINGVKYYPVSERLWFGAESMADKCTYWLTCEYDKFSAEDLDRISALREECWELASKASSGWLCGKDYGRIKKITTQREFMRYAACIASGMDEQRAAVALRG